MNKEDIIYRLAMKNGSKERIIKAINKIGYEPYLLDLIEKYLQNYEVIELINLTNNKVNEDLLMKVVKKQNDNHIIFYDEILELKKLGMDKLVLAIIKIDDDKELLVERTGIYDEELLNCLSNNSNIDTLYILYCNTKDNNILNVILNQRLSIDTFASFEKVLPNDYKIKFMDKLIEECSISSIIDNIDTISDDAIIYMYRKKKEDLTSKDICTILDYKCYENSDMEFLINKLCEEAKAKYLYLLLIDEYDCLDKISKEQKEKIERTLKETKSIEYNLYYEFYKGKDILIKNFGGVLALYLFLKSNVYVFKDKETYKYVLESIEKNVIRELSEKEDVNIYNALFKDEVKYTVKVLKKRKKNLK